MALLTADAQRSVHECICAHVYIVCACMRVCPVRLSLCAHICIMSPCVSLCAREPEFICVLVHLHMYFFISE